MTDQKKSYILGKIVSDNNNQERKSWPSLGQTCSRFLIVVLSQLFVILLIYSVCFWTIRLWKLVTNPLYGWEFCAVKQDTFYPHQDWEQVIFYKNCYFVSLAGHSETGNSQFTYNWLKKGTFQTKFDNACFFSALSDTLWCYAGRDWKSRVCSRCKFSFYRCVIKQRCKKLVKLGPFMWRDSQIKSICWCCYCWHTSWIEYFLHWAQFVSSKHTWPRRLVPENAPCFFQVTAWCDGNQ